MTTALRLSRADTFTPVSYWYEMPLWELDYWASAVADEAARLKKLNR